MKYRYLGDSGLAVSRVCLGAMTFGQEGWGCDQDAATQLISAFVDAGGNFIDTADMYSRGASEEILGRAIREHDRDDLVIATKCYFRTSDKPNAKGLSRKHVIQACAASLRRLGTDYADLYQLHGPDPYTPIEETLRTLDDLIRKGMVRHIGCSNFFAWQFVKANGIAARLAMETFCSGQYLYNLLRRDIEREILPACGDQGMGVLCWSPLASGLLTGKYPRADQPQEGTRLALRADIDVPRYWNDESFEIIDKVVTVAKERNKTPSQVALAWLLREQHVTAVIIGATRVDQLDQNLEVGEWDLPDEDYQNLSKVVPFAPGYPQEWIDLTYPVTFNDAKR